MTIFCLSVVDFLLSHAFCYTLYKRTLQTIVLNQKCMERQIHFFCKTKEALNRTTLS